MLFFLSDEHALMNKAAQTLKYINFLFIETLNNKKVIKKLFFFTVQVKQKIAEKGFEINKKGIGIFLKSNKEKTRIISY